MPLKKEGLGLMWVDEVRLHLAENFQEEIGFSQPDVDLACPVSPSTPKLSGGETQELEHILVSEVAGLQACLLRSNTIEPQQHSSQNKGTHAQVCK